MSEEETQQQKMGWYWLPIMGRKIMDDEELPEEVPGEFHFFMGRNSLCGKVKLLNDNFEPMDRPPTLGHPAICPKCLKMSRETEIAMVYDKALTGFDE